MPVLVTCKFDKYHIKGDWKKLDIIFFIAQGHVTPKWLVRSSRNLNLSKISCLSFLPVSLMKIEFTVTEKKWRHHFLHYKSMGKNFRAQEQITPKWIIRSGPNSNLFELLCLASLPASLAKIQSKVTERSWRHHFVTTQEHITPKWLVRYDQNVNWSEILCSSLPVSLMETEFIVTEKRWRHHFPPFKVNGSAQGRITL